MVCWSITNFEFRTCIISTSINSIETFFCADFMTNFETFLRAAVASKRLCNRFTRTEYRGHVCCQNVGLCAQRELRQNVD